MSKELVSQIEGFDTWKREFSEITRRVTLEQAHRILSVPTGRTGLDELTGLFKCSEMILARIHGR